MDNKKRIAVASSDGIVVNQHFGRATTFYIYEEENDVVSFLETKSVNPICNRGNHDDQNLLENLEKLKECQYLLVSKIGNLAANKAESFGIACYEIPGIIEESIDQLLRFEKVKQLFI